MNRRDWIVGLFLVLLVGSVAVGMTSGTQEGVFVSDVTTTPAEPTVGDTVNLTAQIVNPTPVDFEVSSVSLQTADGSQTLEFRSLEETIGGESDGTVSIARTFTEPGERSLRLVIEGTQSGLAVTRTQSITVEIDTVRRPSVAVAAEDTTVGQETTVSVSLANARNEQLRDVTVELAGDEIQRNRTRYVRPSIAAGQTETFQFGVTPTAAGERTVTAVVEYVTDEGLREQVVRNVTLQADEPRRSVEVSARLGDGARPPVEATLTNLGNVPATDPVITVVSNGTVVGRTTLSELPAGESRTVSVNLSNASSQLTVRAAYTVGGDRFVSETTTAYRSNPAQIRLTGLEFEEEAGVITVSGSASNLGMAPAQGVLVQLASAPGVRPVGPNPEFFVGRVQASDFVSFELTLELADNRTTIPIQVMWLDDGQRRTATTSLDVSTTTAVAPQPDNDSPDTLLLVGIGVVAIGVVAIMGYGLYNSLT